MSESPTEWFLVDHDRDDKRVRGPYATSEAAAAVRQELERHDPYFSEHGNLWVVEALKADGWLGRRILEADQSGGGPSGLAPAILRASSPATPTLLGPE